MRALALAMSNGEKALTKRARYEELKTSLFRVRSSWDGHWRECADFIRPRRSKFQTSDRNRGDRRNQNIIDSTATFASRTLGSGLHAGMSSPARPWFKSTIADPDLAKHKPVQEYLEQVTQIMQEAYSQSNLYQSLPTGYGDYGDFGVFAMAVMPDAKDVFRTRVFPVGSYAIGVDARGLASAFVREDSKTILELVEEFGLTPGGSIDWSRFSPAVKAAWDKGQYFNEVPITWVVTPNPDADASKGFGRYMPFVSCTFENGNDKGGLLKESGFRSFPIMVPRWEVTDNDSYATDWPAAIALGDIKGLQVMHREKAKGVQKQVTPPMVAGYELRNARTSVLPGEVTYTRDPQHGFRAAYQVNFDLGEMRADIQEQQYRIERAYYADLWLMLSRTDSLERDPAKTATEIAERKEEKMLMLGPTLERSNDELFNPLYDRVFEMLSDRGRLPEPPPELDGMDIKPENTSILAQAQKLVGVNAQDRLVSTIASLAAVWPEARHKLKPYVVIDAYGAKYGTDPAFLATDEEAEAAAQAEQEAAQQAAAAENAQKMGAGVASAAGAKLNTGSALDAMVGSL